MKKNESGFTLIEILVVVSILGVLRGLVAILVIKAPQQAQKFKSENRITQLDGAIHRFKSEMGWLPPMTIEGLGKRSKYFAKIKVPDNDINTSIEALCVALNHPEFSAPIGDALGGDAFKNTDEDSFNVPPKGSPTAEAREIVDDYGHPLIYIEKNSYDKGPFLVKNGNDDEVEVQAVRRKNGEAYNKTSFQIISLGFNGIQDPDDELMNFKLEAKD